MQLNKNRITRYAHNSLCPCTKYDNKSQIFCIFLNSNSKEHSSMYKAREILLFLNFGCDHFFSFQLMKRISVHLIIWSMIQTPSRNNWFIQQYPRFRGISERLRAAYVVSLDASSLFLLTNATSIQVERYDRAWVLTNLIHWHEISLTKLSARSA